MARLMFLLEERESEASLVLKYKLLEKNVFLQMFGSVICNMFLLPNILNELPTWKDNSFFGISKKGQRWDDGGE